MAIPSTFNFHTGPANMPDVGTLAYNGCVFSPLFATNVRGLAAKDNAQRTVKLMDYTITADGYVTLADGVADINPQMNALRNLLSAQGGSLTYRGRGMDIIVNAGGAGVTDVAWGPVPEILDFQPLGGGLSAKVIWQVKVRIPETTATKTFSKTGLAALLLQFNYDIVASYGEDGYSSMACRGTVEVPLTRPTQSNRRVIEAGLTADDVRAVIDDRLMAGVDLTRFRITRREFQLSRDKRTLEWSFSVDEKAYMDLPMDCTIARGTYSVRPKTSGMGLCNWLCTLRVTYTVRKDRPRREAWFAFLALLRTRMAQSNRGFVPLMPDGGARPRRGLAEVIVAGAVPGGVGPLLLWLGTLKTEEKRIVATTRPFLIDFSFDEGLYLDSKTTSFSATWRIVTAFSHILLASGLWRKVAEKDATGGSLWATSMRDLPISRSWLRNTSDTSLDVIVDFGGG